MENKPELRFEEFCGGWEESILGDISTSYSGGTPTVGKSEFYDGNIPFIRSAEINSNSTELFISDEGLNNSSAKMVQIGDILYALYGATSGEVGISRINGAINQAILAIKPNQEYNSIFIMQWLRMSKDNIITTFLQGGQGNLSANIVKALELPIPTLPEQQKIGSFFRNLDNLITSKKTELEKLKTTKKAFLSKMFPKDGEDIPQLRFEGFEGKWERRKLGDISKKVIDKNYNREVTETLTNSAEFGIISQMDFFDHSISNNENIGGYYIVKENDFVYNPRISTFAPVGPINRNKLGRNGIMSPLYYVFRTININEEFLEYFFNNNSWHNFMYQNGDSGARSDRFSIKDSVFIEMPISLPTLPEQQKIGSFFQNIDNLINLQQKEIEKLQNIKKALLSKMFV